MARRAKVKPGVAHDPTLLTQELQAALGPGVYAVMGGDHVELHGVADADAARAQAVVDAHGGWVDPVQRKRERITNARTLEDLRQAMLDDLPPGPAPVSAAAKALRPVIFTPQTEFPVPEEPPA